ncbi:MAG TPA: 16S rRNA (guanine(527)-N(7))-methyltransferase RsmG [Solirubrobacteraceae bacterium]|nr:16S rRNA (guanine(527)-N(7))-methyltransferase RsmG [Solirubrobacteraceae bacterium]
MEDALGRLCMRYDLDSGREARLASVLDSIEENDRAPTSVRDRGTAVDVHLADSLSALELGRLSATASIVDLGSGAGFPGLPLAVALPAATVWLIESQRRKAAFIEGVCESAELGNAHVVCARCEEWGEGLDRHDAALARALAPQAVVLEYAAPLLRLGGTLIDWRGMRDADEEERALRAGRELGMRLVEIRHVEPYGGAREHHLHVYEKAASTPSRFPRRAGVARRRPLGC